jgi:hypothetical protein
MLEFGWTILGSLKRPAAIGTARKTCDELRRYEYGCASIFLIESITAQQARLKR